jgi:predicted nuclease of predicted toxin-antitoxin system
MVVYATAQALGAVLVTADKGFGDIRRFPLGTHHGIVVLRVIGKPERQWKALERALCQDLKG